MKGKTIVTLESASISEALEQYLNRHLTLEHQLTVVSWERDTSDNTYNAPERIRVTTEPRADAQPTT